MRLAILLALPLAAAPFLGGCARTVAERDAEVLRQIKEERDARVALFERERRDLKAGFRQPYILEYEGRGTIEVHRLELLGGADQPLVHVQFTYENTTGDPVPIPRVTFVYELPDGRQFEAGSVDLWRPFTTTIANGNAHTTWIDAPTGELHLIDGWTWTLEITFPGEDDRPVYR